MVTASFSGGNFEKAEGGCASASKGSLSSSLSEILSPGPKYSSLLCVFGKELPCVSECSVCQATSTLHMMTIFGIKMQRCVVPCNGK